jgi:predicted GIY-YIG superfamily endonuclease
MAWHVYLVRCGDGTLYTGATNDLPRRFAAHSSGKGARYTRGRGPLVLAWSEEVADRSAALRREHQIKRLRRSEKLRLVRHDIRTKKTGRRTLRGECLWNACACG